MSDNIWPIMNNISRKVVSNLIWRFAERCGAQLVAFVVSVVLARILDPDAYGTVALITVFTAILQVFVDSGLGNALIQKQNADDVDFSTVFYTNILFCTVLYGILFAASPLIAAFYGQPEITPYVRVLGLTVLISGIKNVQQAYVSRHLLFKRFFFSTLGGTLAAAVIAIAMALNGFGIWALVAQQVINLSIDTIILWITVKWRPKPVFSFKRLKSLFSYGWKLLVSSLLNTVYGNLWQLIIGKVYSSADLAYYNKGDNLPYQIVVNIDSSIDSVLLPTLSNVQDERDRVRQMTRRAIQTGIYVMAPLMMGMAFCAEPIVELLYTEKWLGCVPYIRIFRITYMFYPIHTANLNAIKAMGRSDIFLKLEIIKKCVGLVILLFTMPYGVMAMAYGMLLSSFLSQIINSWPNRRLLHYSYFDQLKDILPGILLSVGMGFCVYGIGLALQNLVPLLLILLIQILTGAIIFIVGSHLLRLDSFEYLWNMMKELLHRH